MRRRLRFWIGFAVVPLALVEPAVAGAVLIVAILCATSLLATVLHETGHATVGAVLGFRVHQVSIGSGRTIARMKLAGTEIRIRSRLLGGGFS